MAIARKTRVVVYGVGVIDLDEKVCWYGLNIVSTVDPVQLTWSDKKGRTRKDKWATYFSAPYGTASHKSRVEATRFIMARIVIGALNHAVILSSKETPNDDLFNHSMSALSHERGA